MFTVFGGLFLTIAALYMMRGKIFRANFFYISANFCWLLDASINTNYYAILTIVIGIISNVYVVYNKIRELKAQSFKAGMKARAFV